MIARFAAFVACMTLDLAQTRMPFCPLMFAGGTSVPARALEGVEVMSSADHDPAGRDRLTATWVELAIRLGVLGLLLFLSFTLIRPFITIAIWSVVLTVALYPVYDWMVGWLGGRRRLAALMLTVLNLLIVIGPATWLTLGLIDSIRNLSDISIYRP